MDMRLDRKGDSDPLAENVFVDAGAAADAKLAEGQMSESSDAFAGVNLPTSQLEELLLWQKIRQLWVQHICPAPEGPSWQPSSKVLS